MKTIAIISPVGGAGRTTLTACLSSLLAGRGHAVLALECDPRNVLPLHFGMPAPPEKGLCTRLHEPASGGWADAGLRSDDGVLLVPWGTEADDRASAIRLYGTPDWMAQLLASVALPDDGVVLIDTVAWPSVYAAQAMRGADLLLVVTPPEPEVCATLARFRAALAASAKPCVYVANRVQPARHLHADVMALLRATLGPAMLPYQIHQDVGVAEALARGENFCASAPHSQTAHDLNGLASWLSDWVAGGATTKQARRRA